MITDILEPVRFAITGCGIASDKVRLGYMEEVVSYCIDAPRYIVTGSVRSTCDRFGEYYFVTTMPREW